MRPICLPGALALLMALPAFAEPRVGDRATYSQTTNKDGHTIDSALLAELVRFDTQNHRYLERDTKKIVGQPDRIEETWKETAEMFTDEKVEHMLSNCEDDGGESLLVWEPAGIFSACKMPVRADDVQSYTGWVWIAKVPFGLVRAELSGPDGDSVLDLRSYGFARP